MPNEAAFTGSLTDYVAQELRELILAHKLSPNEPIRQAKLARSLGTSRIPVREALRRLESEGLVVIRPNSGARVAALDLDECVDIYKIRERIEPLALSESIPHLSDEAMAGIRETASSLEERRFDDSEWLVADRDFHLATYGGLRSVRLMDMIVGYWNTTQHYRRLLLSTFTEGDYVVVEQDHRMIVESILAGNLSVAEEALRVHISRSRIHLTERPDLFTG
jgi:DNA-binding GntR family transcriptional regulator